MTRTLDAFREEIARIERDTKELIDTSLTPKAIAAGFITGCAVAKVNVGHALLELAIKGVLPEGSHTRINSAIGKAIDEAQRRVYDHSNAEVPSP